MQVFVTNNYRYISLILVVIIAVLAFYCGTLYGKDSGEGNGVILSCSDDVLSKLAIPLEAISTGEYETTKITSSQGKYFGSKNGTKYYTEGCSAGDRIKPENIIWFENAGDATLQGYSPASC